MTCGNWQDRGIQGLQVWAGLLGETMQGYFEG